MRQGGEPQGVQVVRQGEPTPYHCDFNSLYMCGFFMRLQAAFPCQIAAYYKGLACRLPDYLLYGHVQAAFSADSILPRQNIPIVIHVFPYRA